MRNILCVLFILGLTLPLFSQIFDNHGVFNDNDYLSPEDSLINTNVRLFQRGGQSVTIPHFIDQL